MRRKTDEELGKVFTDGMIDVINNTDLTDEQIGMFVRRILWNSIEDECTDAVVKALVFAFKNQYISANERRISAINSSRKSKRAWASDMRLKARNHTKSETDKTYRCLSPSIERKGREGKVREVSISPVSPLAGTTHEPSAISPDDLLDVQMKKNQREFSGPRMTVDELKSIAETRFCPAVPAEFVETFWKRMTEAGWRDKSNRPIRNPQYELSKWWAQEKKNAAAAAVSVDHVDTEPSHDCVREVC